jgi:hypothetical protein
MIATSDGGYALASGTWNVDSNSNDFLLIKTDAFGNMEWNRTYGGTGNDAAYSLVATSDGGYALAGLLNFSSYKGQPYNSSLLLVKTDKFGNMEWNQTYEGIGDTPNPRLVTASDGGYALTGFTRWLNSYNGGNFCLVKTDALGRLEWNRTYALARGSFASSLVATSDGGYAIAGGLATDSSVDAGDFFLVKTNAFGNMDWNQTYKRTGMAAASSVIVTADGGYALAGSSQTSPGSVEADFWFVKTDKFGNMEWNQTYGAGAGTDFARSMVATADGGYAIAGDTEPYDVSEWRDIWVVKSDALGNMEWNQTYGGKEDERGYSIVATSDGGLAVAGYTQSFGTGGNDFWLVKIDEIHDVPKFSLWTVPILLATATLLILIGKKRLLHKRS